MMEAGTSARSGQRIVALESVRALMAMWVLLGHCGNYLGHFLGQPAPAWIKPLLLTSTPVDIFIVLSGFVIFELLHRRAKFGYLDYITRRARRILPIYIFAIALALFLADFRLDAFVVAPWRTVEEVDAALARASETRADLGLHIGLHAALLHGVVPHQWLPNSAYALLAPAWSLSLEWQFYLLAPLVYAIVSRGAWSHLVLLAGLTIVGLFILFKLPGQFTPAFILVSWPYFALGWWLSKARHRVLQPRQSRWILVMLLVLIVGAALTYAKDMRTAAVSIILALVLIPLCCAQFDRLAPFRWAREGLEARWLVRLGNQSYSLYLLHVLILDAVGALLLRAGAFGSSHLWNFLWLSSLTAALAVAVSAVTYRWIEAPFFQRRA